MEHNEDYNEYLSKTEKSLFQCCTYLCLSIEPSDAFAIVVTDGQTDRHCDKNFFVAIQSSKLIHSKA